MSKSKEKEAGIKVIASNRKARHEYFIEDELETGIILTGSEIKSIRAGHVSLQEAYVRPDNNEMWVIDMHIAPYEQANQNNHEPRRPRKLLMHRREIEKWRAATEQKGYTIVPLRLYITHGLAKLEIGLAKGKQLYDKRQSLAKKDAERRIQRALKDY